MYGVNKKTGSPIIATVESITGHAGIIAGSFERTAAGKIRSEPDPDCLTTMFWDTSVTVVEDGQELFVDDDGEVVPASGIELRETDPWAGTSIPSTNEERGNDAQTPGVTA